MKWPMFTGGHGRKKRSGESYLGRMMGQGRAGQAGRQASTRMSGDENIDVSRIYNVT